MLTRRLAVGAVTTATLSVLVTGTALADGFGRVHCDPALAVCDLDAGAPGAPGDSDPPSDAPASWLTGCRFELAGSSARAEHEGRPGTWFYVQCPGQPVPQFPIFFPDGEPVVSPAELAREARNRLVLPRPQLRTNPPIDQLVGLPTWLWLASWTPVSATAAAPGASVTATAHPTSVTWVLGDGTQVVCGGSGTAYAGGGDPAAPSPDCGHTYRRSSAAQPRGRYPVTVTIEWLVSWSGAGQAGVLAPLWTTTRSQLRVTQAPAVNTRWGRSR